MWRSIKAILLAVVLLLPIFCTACSQRGESLPDDMLSKLDPEKITACQITVLNPIGEMVYKGEETDPERVRAMYEALCHIKIKPVEREAYFGATCNELYFVQDGKSIFVYFFMPVDNYTYITWGEDNAAIILNESELEEDYGWLTTAQKMLEDA